MAREMYSVTVTHKGLGKTRVISGSNRSIVQDKAEALASDWSEAWSRVQQAQQLKQDKDRHREQLARNKAKAKDDEIAYKESQAEQAQERTQEAQDAIAAIEGLLAHTLKVNDVVQWDKLKKWGKFPKKPPQPTVVAPAAFTPAPAEPHRYAPGFEEQFLASAGFTALPEEPSIRETRFQPVLGLFAAIFMSSRRKQELTRQAHAAAVQDWKSQCATIEAANESARQVFLDQLILRWKSDKRQIDERNAMESQFHLRQVESALASDRQKMSQWQAEKDAYIKDQQEHNQRLDDHKKAYEQLDQGAVCDYFDLVLGASAYPDALTLDWEIDYVASSRTVVVNYVLPTPDQMPTLKAVKYFSSRDEFKETHLSEKEVNALYDAALYQIALRTVHELLESDYVNALDAVVFNGFVSGVDKASGHAFTACIMSLQASKEEFMAINLSNIDPKTCFKKLKGVGSSQLHGLAPVAPILQMDRSDARFVASHAVANALDESTNLAAMDWEEFEHLVRELFEKEFHTSGGEVRITQASRDGGVDAVAFDPDPIRGGKIVIQAKRYSNVVGVSAVRDLYGTVMNEGATKGILVTTADFGPDSYAFAKDKPLTLLNGSNLLHLLAKHGHKANIDIAAARTIQHS